MALLRSEIDDGFALIERAAAEGARAPTNISIENPAGTIRPGITTVLLKEGRIKVEVYAHNWRVIEIVTGIHAGKRTKSPANKNWKPYRILPQPPEGVSARPTERPKSRAPVSLAKVNF